MKKNKMRLLAGALVVTLLLGGCRIGGKEIVITGGLGSQDVCKIGGTSCKLTEARVYLANYQNIYGKGNGTDLWKKNFAEKN